MNSGWSFPHNVLDHHRLMQVIAASILLMAIIGGAAYGFVHATLHIAGDPYATATATATATAGKLDLVALAAWAWLLVALLDVIVSMGVYPL